MKLIESAVRLTLMIAAILGPVSATYAATLISDISHDGTCIEAGPCAPVSEFRVYEATGDLIGAVANQGVSTLDLDYSLVIGQEYCYDFTAFNGQESEPFRACATAETVAPTGPTVIFRFQ